MSILGKFLILPMILAANVYADAPDGSFLADLIEKARPTKTNFELASYTAAAISNLPRPPAGRSVPAPELRLTFRMEGPKSAKEPHLMAYFEMHYPLNLARGDHALPPLRESAAFSSRRAVEAGYEMQQERHTVSIWGENGVGNLLNPNSPHCRQVYLKGLTVQSSSSFDSETRVLQFAEDRSFLDKGRTEIVNLQITFAPNLMDVAEVKAKFSVGNQVQFDVSSKGPFTRATSRTEWAN